MDQQKKDFSNNWDDDRKKSLYQLIGFGVFFLLAFMMLLGREPSSNNTLKDENNDSNISDVEIVMKEQIHNEMIKNYSYSFKMEIILPDETITFEGKHYNNKIDASSSEKMLYYIDDEKTYLFNSKTNEYELTEDNIYLKEFDYKKLVPVILGCTFDLEEEIDEGTKRSYHYEDNKITTIENDTTLQIKIEMEMTTITILYDEINKIEDFTNL